jgi:ATP-dependent DNA helicase RecG
MSPPHDTPHDTPHDNKKVYFSGEETREEIIETREETAETRVETIETREETIETREENIVETGEKIIFLVLENPSITGKELAEKIGLTEKGVEWQIRKLKEEGRLQRIGPNKGGKWLVL